MKTLFDDIEDRQSPVFGPAVGVDPIDWEALLSHPYPTYGLAVALFRRDPIAPLESLSQPELAQCLANAIDEGLENFRLETSANPDSDLTQKYEPIKRTVLLALPQLVSGSLAAKGKFLYPSIITSDAKAKGTFEDAVRIAEELRKPTVTLLGKSVLKRSLSPCSGEINNGSSDKKNQQATLFEVACAAVATVTPFKPAALSELNTAVYPDLPLSEMIEFIRVFRKFQFSGRELNTSVSKKLGAYRRPKLHSGNFPDAPFESGFGGAGVLAALGYWANRASDDRDQALAALNTLKDRPLYVVNYKETKQSVFGDFVVELAKAGNLYSILVDFYRFAHPYSMSDSSFVNFREGTGFLFQFSFNRFLQRFDRPSFQDFLSFRAEYPASLETIIEGYFMQKAKIPMSTVRSARALGQWLNFTAYRAAYDSLGDKPQKGSQAARSAKAKVLVEFESSIMSADSPEDMLHRVSTRAGRLLQSDIPPEASEFFDVTASSTIDFKSAQHLLIAYLRLRSGRTEEVQPEEELALDNDDTPASMEDEDNDN